MAPLGTSKVIRVSVAFPLKNALKDTVEKIEVKATSGRGEPAGETFFLVETGPDTGIFEIDLGLTRLYDDAGLIQRLATDGKLSVDAEGSLGADEITLAVGDRLLKVPYAEPPSTVTGTVRVGGVAVGGALITLIAGNGARQETASRADGVYAFHDVPSGAYTLVAGARGALQQTFKVSVP